MSCLRGEPFGVMVRREFDLWGEQCDGLMNNAPKYVSNYRCSPSKRGLQYIYIKLKITDTRKSVLLSIGLQS